MYIVPIAWLYVTLLMAVAEATSSQGSVLGAVITFVLYGVLPISIVAYIMATPARRRASKARELADLQAAQASACAPRGSASGNAPDAGGKTPADPVATMRKEA
ncbi:MAG: hypothetical protein IPN53_12635 [Comamonadaceae bacterium]|nr:hypothetical protein [Comamonadaceae bacterium]